MKNSALAHLPSGHFGANSAWLVAAMMAYNLTRTASSARPADAGATQEPKARNTSCSKAGYLAILKNETAPAL